MTDLADKAAIVTGGGSDIGEATALAIARAGASVVIAGRDADKGEAAAEGLRQSVGRAVFHRTDVSKPAEVRALVARTVSDFGRLDLAFNNAGADGQQVPLHEQDIGTTR